MADLLATFDWALAEDWCDRLLPFVAAGKAVFSAEYTDTGTTTDRLCPQATAMNLNAILKHLDLDAYREACPPGEGR